MPIDEESISTNNANTFIYRFMPDNGENIEVTVKLDKENLNLIRTENILYSKWAELNFYKCPNCPLDESKHKFCPVALNLVELVDIFGHSLSYEEVDIIIATEVRKYSKHTSLQKGLSSLIGIFMVTSGCPIMEKLKPMVRYHLPFATEEETKYRAVSMYLFAQYFLYRRDIQPDWELTNLVRIYEDIRIVNRNFYKRLAAIKIKDAGINALVILDCFADAVNFSINRELLKEMESMFAPYFKP